MISSMTGYAVAAEDAGGGALQLELRSVNSRFLDLQFRIGDELRSLEPMLREMIVSRVSRGKVECRFNWNRAGASAQPQRLDAHALSRLRSLARQAAKAFPKAPPLRIADVLRWPGVAAEQDVGAEQLRATAGRLCRQALDELIAAREREGAKLAAAVGERLAAMRRQLAALAPLLPAAMNAYREKISERLRDAIGSALGAADDERVRAEVALFAAKSDVDEELTRLRAHLDEMERTLAGGKAAGKRLDFIAQELNREANTLASKAASSKIADGALELKVLVEQIREQVQNIE
jgi:uncharacterized protein (TIGR00255 family)